MNTKELRENSNAIILAIDSTYLHQSKMKTFFVALSFIVLLLNSTVAHGQNNLTIFDDFIDKVWIGHYQDSEDSLIIHTIKWNYDLNKQVIKEIKVVPEVSFYCETYYFWDYETDQISYLSLMNKKMISRGTVIKQNGKLELSGKTFFQNGFQENKKTYEITEDGKLKDYFYRKSKGKWVQGHFIQYSLKNNNEKELK